MFIVTNRIKMKSGFAEKMAPMFTKGGAIEELKGFIKIETWSVQNNEHDELHVNTYWETLEDFEAWKTSDAFKQAHSRPSGGGEKGESPMLGSELVISKLETKLEK
ncbi:heme oxygenase [Macrococcus equipercicus]|uniref:Signal transduction protein TRAP n=1 Tax=Macrococcus equipercicus TaxID=69967 RepID=A0A9Q9BU73_9STAP|nr:heme oxygenase [Macrococcus equipercicus]KAA1037637.1 heme oxygenase [Macrococcus equipercicus]UTH14151.1 heme oxygenase [Macrococcus equipercicus]